MSHPQDEEQLSSTAISFFEEVERAVKKAAARCGYDVPGFSGQEFDGVVFLSMAAYPGRSTLFYRKWFIEKASIHGLPLQHLDTPFFSKDHQMQFQLLGLDPEGGENCLRVIDQFGKHYHMTPFTAATLIANSSEPNG